MKILFLCVFFDKIVHHFFPILQYFFEEFLVLVSVLILAHPIFVQVHQDIFHSQLLKLTYLFGTDL